MTKINDNLNLIKPKILTVCTIDNIAPMVFQDDAGQWVGYEVDILKEIANNLHLELEFKTASFEEVWKQPVEKTCDVAAAIITLLPSREQEGVAFSEPYLILNQSLLIRKQEQKELTDISQFVDKTIAVIPGTTGEKAAKDCAPKGVHFKASKDEAGMLTALKLGEVDAIARGVPGNLYQVRINSDFAIIDLKPTHEKVSLAMAKENSALLDTINQQISDLKTKAMLASFSRKWFEVELVPD